MAERERDPKGRKEAKALLWSEPAQNRVAEAQELIEALKKGEAGRIEKEPVERLWAAEAIWESQIGKGALSPMEKRLGLMSLAIQRDDAELMRRLLGRADWMAIRASRETPEIWMEMMRDAIVGDKARRILETLLSQGDEDLALWIAEECLKKPGWGEGLQAALGSVSASEAKEERRARVEALIKTALVAQKDGKEERRLQEAAVGWLSQAVQSETSRRWAASLLGAAILLCEEDLAQSALDSVRKAGAEAIEAIQEIPGWASALARSAKREKVRSGVEWRLATPEKISLGWAISARMALVGVASDKGQAERFEAWASPWVGSMSPQERAALADRGLPSWGVKMPEGDHPLKAIAEVIKHSQAAGRALNAKALDHAKKSLIERGSGWRKAVGDHPVIHDWFVKGMGELKRLESGEVPQGEGWWSQLDIEELERLRAAGRQEITPLGWKLGWVGQAEPEEALRIGRMQAKFGWSVEQSLKEMEAMGVSKKELRADLKAAIEALELGELAERSKAAGPSKARKAAL